MRFFTACTMFASLLMFSAVGCTDAQQVENAADEVAEERQETQEAQEDAADEVAEEMQETQEAEQELQEEQAEAIEE